MQTSMPDHPLLITCHAVSGQNGDQAGAPAVLIQEGRILAVGEEALASDAPRLDLKDMWLSPAPLDAHVHLCLGGEASDNLAATARASVAAVRDLGHSAKKAAPSQAPGQAPLLVSSGRGLGPKGEGKSWLADACPDLASIGQTVDQRLAAGVGVIKLFATGLLDFEHPGLVEHPLGLGKARMAAAVEKASQAGLKVAVHVSGEETVNAALDAGVASIEHGFFLGRGTLERMARLKTAWVPTLAAVLAHYEDPQKRHPQETRDNLGEIARSQKEAMLLGEKLGVELVLGTDAGSYGLSHGQAVFKEMEAWLEAGLRPETVFQAATKRAARLMGLEDELGVIKPGACSWLLACPGDPARDPLLLAQPAWRGF